MRCNFLAQLFYNQSSSPVTVFFQSNNVTVNMIPNVENFIAINLQIFREFFCIPSLIDTRNKLSLELERSLTARMHAAAEAEQYEAAARLRDQLSTVHQLQEKQRIATAEQSDDADVFGYHFEDDALAVNLFHMRNGKIVDRREFFFEDLAEILETPIAESDERIMNEVGAPGLVSETGEPASDSQNLGAPSMTTAPSSAWMGNHESTFNPGTVFSALLKQLYIDQNYVPRSILVPVDFDDREALATLLSERINHRVEIAVPQRGEKKSLIDLVGQNARQSYIQRFRVLEPSRKAIQESLADSLMLPELPRRIECFDISHIQGAETVASMVVWEDGKMNKSAYRKFKVMTVLGVDDFASMREVVTRRYKRIRENSTSRNHQRRVPQVSLLRPGRPTRPMRNML